MKRIFIITLITCLLIPFFTINSSAATYDLGDPSLWVYSSTVTSSPNYFSTHYFYYANDLHGFEMSYRLLFYPNGYQKAAGFDRSYSLDLINFPVFDTDVEPTYDNAGYKYRATDLDLSKNVLAFVTGYNIRSSMVIPGISYSDIYLPDDGQYFKIQFSVDTVKLGTSYDIPSQFLPLLSPENLCFFELPGRSEYDVPSVIVPFSSVVVQPSTNGRILHYTYYFNSSSEAFAPLRENNENGIINLVIRFPYYFGDSQLLIDGAFILTNYDFPVSYDIITPGGYSQELEGIQNAIISSNDNLIDYYDTLSGEDQAVIVHAKQQNDKLDSTIKDYDKAQSGIDKIVENVTLPPVNIDDANSAFDDIGLGNISENEGLWSIAIVSMVIITFTFATLSLLLFGKKG